jgi:hypothetical protein
MNFNELIITANTPLETIEGVPLASGVYFKIKPELQWLTLGNERYNAIFHAWTDEACCTANKSVLSLAPWHDLLDISTDENPMYKSFGYEIELQIAITDETDVDTDEKVKALIIAELATALSKQPTDFS